MNLDTLKEIVKVAKDQGVAELKVEAKEYKVSVSFISGVAAPIVHHQPVQQSAAPVAHVAPVVVAKPVSSDAGLHVIKSPFVGTFYGSPSPGKPVYCKVGDKVKAGQALCVLEAMKIMNEIDADIAGEVVEICVENESLVEFGQPLFKIKPN
jgi:acetyl-CoA carboxylase biotin carboxyl carrier protein